MSKHQQKFVVEVENRDDINWEEETIATVLEQSLSTRMPCKVKCVEVIGTAKLKEEILKKL